MSMCIADPSLQWESLDASYTRTCCFSTTSCISHGFCCYSVFPAGTVGIIISCEDKRSLREIQEEERALEAEASFLKWWTAEEERVREEVLALKRRVGEKRGGDGRKGRRKGGSVVGK